MRLTNFVKKQVSKVLCAALVLSSVAVAGEIRLAEAASKTEIETYGTVLTLGKSATGELSAADEQDWYIFDITEQGYFSVVLQRNDNANTDEIDYGWKYSLYQEDDLVNAVTSTSSITNRCESEELPLPEGRYYVCVEASDRNWGRDPLNCPYDVIVNFTKSEEWEYEYNDTSALSNSIEVNKTYFGNLHNSEDVDWYKVTTPENGTIQLNFGPDASTDVTAMSDGWKVIIFDEGMNTMRDYTYITKWMPQLIPVQEGTFYINVKASDNAYRWGSEPVGCDYNLQLNFTPTTEWEMEYNNEYATANTIISGNECHGVLSWKEDKDWYRIDNKSAVIATLQFRVDDSVSVDIPDGWKIVVYNANREQITEIDDIKKTNTKEDIRLPEGSSYIEVLGSDNAYRWDSQPIDCIYHLTVTTTPVKVPDTTSNPSETPDNTSTPDNTTKPDDTSKPSNTSKPNSSTANSKPNTTNQPNSTSNEVMEKAITTSKVTTSTITSKKKKSVYLRWKKQKYAGGYEIYRSTKKKSGYKKVKTIKNSSKVSWTDKKVKGGKTYFYKIRAYRKIGGKKSVSGFSKVKRVKVKK